MTLLLPLIVIILGTVFLAVCRHSDENDDYFGLLLAAFGFMLLSPFVFLAYGAIQWLRFGEWQRITVLDSLAYLNQKGLDVSYFLQQVEWQGIQKINELYLDTNIGWTFLWVPIAIIHLDSWLESDRKKRIQLKKSQALKKE